MFSICFAGIITEAVTLVISKTGRAKLLPWGPHSASQYPAVIALNCLWASVLYLNLFCASIRKMGPEVIASLLDAILVYEKFCRNALLSESGKISIRTSNGRRGTDFYLCFLALLFLKIKITSSGSPSRELLHISLSWSELHTHPKPIVSKANEKTMTESDFYCFNSESQRGMRGTLSQSFMQVTDSREPTVSLCHVAFTSVTLENTYDKSF